MLAWISAILKPFANSFLEYFKFKTREEKVLDNAASMAEAASLKKDRKNKRKREKADSKFDNKRRDTRGL